MSKKTEDYKKRIIDILNSIERKEDSIKNLNSFEDNFYIELFFGEIIDGLPLDIECESDTKEYSTIKSAIGSLLKKEIISRYETIIKIAKEAQENEKEKL